LGLIRLSKPMSAQPDRVYRALRGLTRLLMRLFFREVVVEGVENLPPDRGGLMIAGHPNGLVDPALIFAHFPGRIVFGARHGLLEWPVIGPLMRRVGTVPIYRAADDSDLSRADKKVANERSLERLAQELARGSFSALFPEGLSHDMPHLSEVKTGASRLYYCARNLKEEGAPDPAIIPVGLYYDRKNIFRSRVLVTFHPPLELPEELDVRPGGDPAMSRQAVAGLTELIDRTLVEVVGATKDWHIHHLMHRARKLVRADLAWQNGTDYRKPGLAESQMGYGRIWSGYQERRGSSKVADVLRRLKHYDRYLRTLGLEDHELTERPRMASPLLVLLFLGQLIAVYLLFPPILVLGVIINVGPYFLLKWVTRRLSHAKKDEATIKLLGGAVLFPMVWAGTAVLAWLGEEQLRALFPTLPDLAVWVVVVTVAIGIFGGYLALVYTELSAETLRALRVRLLRKRRASLIQRLILERSALCAELVALGEGLNLPGQRQADGSILAPP
jgi:glycerol-3-phosphate O-acyltransferase / dihydroxyacetone phosphate acyltransferase